MITWRCPSVSMPADTVCPEAISLRGPSACQQPHQLGGGEAVVIAQRDDRPVGQVSPHRDFVARTGTVKEHGQTALAARTRAPQAREKTRRSHRGSG
jgi:hypothetical protein